jgi:tocopherol cyclase
MKLLFALFLVATAPAFAADPYNAYLWREGDGQPWFEWWYYKVVDPTTHDAFFFTYGVVDPGHPDGRNAGHAILQVGSFGQNAIAVEHFPLAQFAASRDATNVRIGPSTATDQRITGSAESGNITWDLAVEKTWGFEAMGWTMHHAGLSNIYWYPAQASATMTGTVTFRGRTYYFQHAPAYQDRNWGRSFPDWWTWLVSNDFPSSPGTALAAGGGKPRVFNGPSLFDGLCIGFHHHGKEYAWRTTDGDRVDMDIRWGKWEVSASNQNGDRIVISAFAPKEKFLLLPFDTPESGRFYDYEALAGHMAVTFTPRDGSPETLETESAGIEWGSPNPVLFARIFDGALPRGEF